MPTFPEGRLRLAGLSAARIAALRAEYDASPPARQQTLRGVYVSATDETLRHVYGDGIVEPGGLSPEQLAATHDTDPERETYVPARLSEGALRAAFGSRPQALRANARPLVRPQEAVLSAIAAGHGWTATGGWASSNLDDTTDPGWSDRCLTGVTAANGSGCNFQKTGLPAFDPAGRTFLAFLKVSDPTKLSSAQLYLGASTAMTDATIYAALGGSGQLMQPDEWFPVIFTAHNATVTGTGAGTAVTVARFRFADKGAAGAITVKLGGLSTLPPPAAYPTGALSFTFDDAYASVVTVAKPALSKYRYRGTVYPILDQLGQSGRLTLAQLTDLEQHHYWEVGAHASTTALHQAGFPALSVAALDTELATIKGWLLANGFRGDSLAYPLGQYNLAVVNAARGYFSSARTTDAAQLEVFPPADPLRLRSLSVTSTTTLAAVQAAVDVATTNRQHLVLTFHNLATTPAANSTEWGSANFATLVDYVATKGVAVRPVSAVLAAA